MLNKGNLLHSILKGSCPRCHSESMYKESNPYHLNKLYDMHENCSKCGLQYKIEPSFFYGAMYVSYALTVAIGVAAFIITKIFLGMNLVQAFIAIIIALIVLTPVTARLSRNIYINMFVHFDKNYLNK